MVFSRYYNERKELVEVSMDEIEILTQEEINKDKIAKHIYERLYTRFLKIFEYSDSRNSQYQKNGISVERKIFNEEFKNGFLQLAASSLLIETFAAFLTGNNETPRGKAPKQFNKVFEYAESKNNKLKVFKSSNYFYEKIRCGILHQGETKGKYLITRRNKKLLDGDEIDAHIFHQELKSLLNSYKKDLENSDWNNEIWINCRDKIKHIINNSK